MRLVAAEQAMVQLPTGVYYSSDYGYTWKLIRVITENKQVSLSADGRFILLAGRALEVSSNYGRSWQFHGETECRIGVFAACSVSSDGMHMYALPSYGRLWASHDQGTTWTNPSYGRLGIDEDTTFANPLSRAWSSLSVSRDGQGVYAFSNLFVAISMDYGVTFDFVNSTTYEEVSQSKGLFPPLKVASSSSGMIVVGSGSYASNRGTERCNLYTSNDGGYSFKLTYSGYNDPGCEEYATNYATCCRINSVTCSADGRSFVAVTNRGAIFSSNNGGQSWFQLNNTGNVAWRSVAMSSSGNRWVAGQDVGYIYSYGGSVTPAPTTSGVPESTSVTIKNEVVPGDPIYVLWSQYVQSWSYDTVNNDYAQVSPAAICIFIDKGGRVLVSFTT